MKPQLVVFMLYRPMDRASRTNLLFFVMEKFQRLTRNFVDLDMLSKLRYSKD